jgi:hypothetical protein
MGFTKAHHGHPRSTRGTAPRPPGFPSTVSRMPSHERPRSDSRGLVFLPPLSGLSQYVECSEACCGGGSVSAQSAAAPPLTPRARAYGRPVPPHPRLASWSSACAYRVETCRAPGALRLREPVHGEHDLRGDQRVMRSVRRYPRATHASQRRPSGDHAGLGSSARSLVSRRTSDDPTTLAVVTAVRGAGPRYASTSGASADSST